MVLPKSLKFYVKLPVFHSIIQRGGPETLPNRLSLDERRLRHEVWCPKWGKVQRTRLVYVRSSSGRKGIPWQFSAFILTRKAAYLTPLGKRNQVLLEVKDIVERSFSFEQSFINDSLISIVRLSCNDGAFHISWSNLEIGTVSFLRRPWKQCDSVSLCLYCLEVWFYIVSQI